MVAGDVPKPRLHVLMMPDYRKDNPYQTLLAEALEHQNVRVFFPWGYRRVLPLFRMATEKQSFYQVLHLHWLTPYIKGESWLVRLIYVLKFWLDVLMVKGAGVRVVWTVHNQLSHDTQFPRLELWLHRVMTKLADQLIVHHAYARDYVADTYGGDRSKIAIIPHGHYRSIYPPAIDQLEARRRLGLPQTGLIYLNFGMLRPYKGIERLLQVWKENQDLFADHTLLIAGQACDEIYQQKLDRLATDSKGVILHPKFIEEDQVHLYFSAADLVVLPFEKVLTSGTLLLAMSYGKPIIAPRFKGIIETLAQVNELLYELDDQQGLAYMLRESSYLNLDELSQKMKNTCDRLNWQAIADKTASTYIRK